MAESLVERLETELAVVEREIAVLQERRDHIRRLLNSYSDSDSGNGKSTQLLPTIQMAEKVLETSGSTMSTAEIRRAIQRRFGVMPASSLQQMLYMRSVKRKVFFNENKKYGLLAWRK